MAKAKRVHSTPRRTASKIQPVKNPEQHDLNHGKAFRGLESSIHQLYCMAEITSDIATGVHEDQDEMMHFAIDHLCEMIRGLRAKYRADLRAGKAVAS